MENTRIEILTRNILEEPELTSDFNKQLIELNDTKKI